MITETVWRGRDNYIRLELIVNGQPQPTHVFTKMDLVLYPKSGGSKITLSSTNNAGNLIRWNGTGYRTNEVRLFLGGSTLVDGSYIARLVVYDTAHQDGVVWGDEPIEILVRTP